MFFERRSAKLPFFLITAVAWHRCANPAPPRMLASAAAILLAVPAAHAAPLPAPPAANCSCVYTETDMQCTAPGLPTDPPCDLDKIENVSSAEACGAHCLADPKCFAASWNGASDDHWNQCWLKGANTTLAAMDVTTSCVCRGPRPDPLPPPPPSPSPVRGVERRLQEAAAPITPTVEIAPGVEMFRVSLGTCCGSQPKVGLAPWLSAGGRGIDTAYDYGKNVPGGPQQDVAAVLAATSTARGDVFITSKIPAGLDPTGKQCRAGTPEMALETIKENLKELNTTCAAAILMHREIRSTIMPR